MSLIEVLISMFVLLFGLMGVAAIFPIGNYYVVEGEKFDLASGIAQNAFEDLRARGMLKPEFWHYADPSWNLAAVTRTEDYPPAEYETLFMQPKTLNALISGGNPSGVNPDTGTFNITGAFGSGHAFVIDPMGATSDITLDNVDIFPRFTDLSNPTEPVINLGNPWNAILPGTRWPVRRLTVLDANGLMSGSVAETIFRLRDDLAVEQPDENDVPSIQRWDVADLNTTPTPNDPTDDSPLRRQYKGDYSWLATIVPTTGAGLAALQPANDDYGEISCDVSIVIFRKRDETPSAESERLIQAELLQGGELVIYSTNGTFAKDEVDAAVDDIRPGNWISLMGVNQTTGDFVMKWYRLLSLDDETAEIGVVTTDSLQQGRRAMLIGPDWPASGLVSNSTGTALTNLRAGILPGVISVVTKPLRMENTSLWNLE